MCLCSSFYFVELGLKRLSIGVVASRQLSPKRHQSMSGVNECVKQKILETLYNDILRYSNFFPSNKKKSLLNLVKYLLLLSNQQDNQELEFKTCQVNQKN